jgi:hypothetical protein
MKGSGVAEKVREYEGKDELRGRKSVRYPAKPKRVQKNGMAQEKKGTRWCSDDSVTAFSQ